MRIFSSFSKIPSGVWVLGFVSMLMDISSEMIHSLLPLFMVGTLGTSVLIVGIIEGFAEAIALIVKIFSGMLSDFLGKRKWVTLAGYALGAFTKPFFAVSGSIGVVMGARFTDRVGKGIRGAPRDALIADITPVEVRGAAYGLRQSLDTLGAFIGPLLAVLLMFLWANDFRKVFWVAVIPGIMAVLLIIFGVKEPEKQKSEKRVNPLNRDNLRKLSSAYWWVVVIGAMFTLARFSEAFLVLKAKESGVAIAVVPLVMVIMNLVYSLSAYPFGKLSDKVSHTRLLVIGVAVLIAADLVLAFTHSWVMMILGVIIWGVHMGMTQGLMSRMVADAAPAELRGTAYGFFNLISGLSMLVASVLAGLMWDRIGSSATFFTGGFFCFLTLAALLLHDSKVKPGLIQK